jgi:hypothetical protein
MRHLLIKASTSDEKAYSDQKLTGFTFWTVPLCGMMDSISWNGWDISSVIACQNTGSSGNMQNSQG